MSAAGECSAVAMDDVDPASSQLVSSELLRSEASASGRLTANNGPASEGSGSGLLAEIKRLRDTQKALKDEKKDRQGYEKRHEEEEAPAEQGVSAD